MTRIRSFAAPHKGLRHVLAKFSFYLGYADMADAGQLARLKQVGQELFILLNDHVHTENEHTLKHLEERMPGAAAHDQADHERLELVQDSLAQRLQHLTGQETADDLHAFYLDFSSFHSQYLQHIFEEETVTESLLQEHFTDEELIQHRISIMQRVEFPVLLLWLKYIIPAQNEAESVGMLSGFRSVAPTEAFEQVLTVIQEAMEKDRYRQLVSALDKV